MPVATPGSPPKRMTRARAKAVEEIKKAPARSTKPATATTSKAIAARNTKRKTRPDDDDVDEDHTAKDASQRQPSTTASRSKPQPEASKDNRSTSALNHHAKTSSVTSRLATASSAAKSVRGRPKATPVEVQEDIKAPKAAQGPARSTRARTGSVSNNMALQKSTAASKKVTFQDDDNEKENIPAKPTKSATQTAKSVPASGLKAKPVRTVPTKSTLAKGKSKPLEDSKLEPLSPRKNVQVSQSSISQADPAHTPFQEAATPIKELNKTPIRIATPSVQRSQIPTPAKKPPKDAQPTQQENEELDTSFDELQGSTAIFTSPTKTAMQASTLASPPKRPGSSPYKGALNVSPRRFGNEGARQLQEGSESGPAEPTLSKPPQRFPMSEPRKKPTYNSSAGSELGTSLFQSPPKKLYSPSKGFVSNINAPATTSVVRVMTPSLLQQSPRRGLFSPSKNITSALKATKSPETSVKVYKMTPAEQAKMLEEELGAVASPYSPLQWVQPKLDGKLDEEVMGTPIRSNPVPEDPFISPPRSPTPEMDSIKPHQILNNIDPALCPSPSLDGNVSMLEPVAPANIAPQQIRPFEDGNYMDDVESEDELQKVNHEAYYTSPLKMSRLPLQDGLPATPKPADREVASARQDSISMTVLAERFGGWQGATPDEDIVQKRKEERSMFTPLHPIVDGLEGAISATPTGTCTEADETELDEDITILEDEDEVMVDSPSLAILQREDFRRSHMSDVSQEYGDENAVPIDPTLLVHPEPLTATCTPARVFETRRKIVHTVCKVPLKPAADDGDSPISKTSRRTHSLSADLSSSSALELEALRQINPRASKPLAQKDSSMSTYHRVSKFSEMLTDDGDSQERHQEACATPSDKTETWSAAVATPGRTPRAGLNTKLLSGAVVFVDVHTSEGADASGIFIELLQQMGAKCVKQWNWSSRNSLGGSENAAGDLAAFGSTRVGITHVVFKDGGKRTMEKVREAKGLVLCVGVGWVLDCEKENKWLDEANYGVDSSTIPRGGHRRRKSMEPKALSNTTFAPPAVSSQMSPTKEFLDLSSPVNRRATTIGLPKASQAFEASLEATQEAESPTADTPRPSSSSLEDDLLQTPIALKQYGDSAFYSPATPYFFHPEQLVQQTCPPKQSHQVLFPVTGRIEDEPDERLRQRLLLARRKSLQWAPKVASPLSRAHSFQ